MKEADKLERDGKKDEAIAKLIEVRDLYPDFVEKGSAYESLANAYLAKDDKTAAMKQLEAYSRVGGRDPETAEPWRAKGSTAQLGFHSFKIDWVDKEYTAQDLSMAIARTQRMTLAMADYMTEVGASLEFLRARLKATAASMNYMSNEEALSLGVYIVNDKTGELITPGSLKKPARS